jgi:superfamily II DNA or RNA helicase
VSTTTSHGLAVWPADRKLRAWQGRAVPTILNHDADSFLLEACPGAGKTTPALRVTYEMLAAGRVERVVVLAPTANLARQWAHEAAQFGIKLEPNWASPVMPRDTHGIVITYHRLAANAVLHRFHAGKTPTLVIADEPHHMGEAAAWGSAYRTAFEPAIFRLLLSGTPFRSDNDPIPGVRYGEDGMAQPDFTYSYAEAINNGICRKIAFVGFDGEMRWSSDGTVIEASFGDKLDQRQSRLRHRTAISPVLHDGLVRMLREADTRLTAIRKDGHDDAGGLVIACDIQHAKQIAGLLEGQIGEPVTIVTSDEPDATLRIERFARGRSRWIVAVAMVSEGVDIPRLRVGVYATTVKTPLFFRQVIGRFVRTRPGMGSAPSFLYLPADPDLQRLAREVEESIRHQLVALDDDEPTISEAETDIEATPSSYVPLDARVVAQETFMSGLRFRDPDQAAAIDTLSRQLGIGPEEVLSRLQVDNEPVLPELPAETEFERRERLRRERKRLVGILHHVTGREYREIQQYVNEAVAASRSVDEHTVAELERAVRLLTRMIAEPNRHSNAEAA